MNKIRLNLGSGSDYKNGWINVDADNKTKTDIEADLSKNFPFKENYADEILASDILEHFTKEDGKYFLLECWRVLKPNGTLILRTHNIYNIIKQFKDDPEVLIHFIYGDTSETGVLGSHKFAYTKEFLTKILKKTGFDEISIKEETTNWFIKARKSKKIKFANLKIAVIQQSPDMGGAETFMLSLLKSFTREGHIVYVSSNKGKYLSQLMNSKYEVSRIPVVLDFMGNLKGLIKSILLLPLAIIFYLKLLNQYKKNNVEVILLSNFSEKLLVTFLSIFFKIPVVWIEYGPLQMVFKRNLYVPKILYRALKNIPKRVIVPSRNTRQSLIVDARVSQSKIEIVPCGLDMEIRKKSFKKNTAKVVIGNISRSTEEKGQGYLLDAIPEILKKNKNVKFIFIGDGPDIDKFIKKAKELKIDKYVEFTGFVNNIDEHLSNMDIFIFPTVWELEGFGLVAVEAMSRKVPVIGNDIAPVKEVLDGGAGVLVDVKDSRKLANETIQLIENRKLRNKIARLGFEKAQKDYDIKNISKIYVDIFYDEIYYGK